MTVFYVSGPPEATIGDSGNVMLHVPINEDEMLALSFRTRAAFDLWQHDATDVVDLAETLHRSVGRARLFEAG